MHIQLNINKIQQQFNINANYCVSVRYSYACSKITELLITNILVLHGTNMDIQIRRNDIGYFAVFYLGRIVEAQSGSSST